MWEVNVLDTPVSSHLAKCKIEVELPERKLCLMSDDEDQLKFWDEALQNAS